MKTGSPSKVDEFLALLAEQPYGDIEHVITVLLEQPRDHYPELETFLDELYDLMYTDEPGGVDRD